MTTNFSFISEYAENGQVEFSIMQTESDEQCYGIKAVLTLDGREAEVEAVECKYFTLCEAEQVIEMLCRHQVMPGTLCDIL